MTSKAVAKRASSKLNAAAAEYALLSASFGSASATSTNNRTLPATPQKNSDDDRPLCRFFFLQGNCRFEDDCAYSHSLPDGISFEVARSQIPCPYFARGNCRYGDYCQLLHDPRELASTCIPVDAAEAPSTPPENRPSDTCGICLDSVATVGHKFGLLSCCRHTFCFECLMEWRKEGSKEAEDRRTCPACRKKSEWVIPSVTMPRTEEEKDLIATQYKKRLARIPCKHFEAGELGSCPYGSDCFYAHLDLDGKDCKSQDRSMKQLYELRNRKRSSRNLESDIEMLSQMILMDLYAYRGLGFDFLDDFDDDYDSEEDEYYLD